MSGVPSFPRIDAEAAGQRFAFVADAQERFELLIATIEAAREKLRLLFYIYGDGEAGRRVNDALIEARNRGVEVVLFVDGFGTKGEPDSFYAPLVDAGVRFARFFPTYGRRYLLRNHQKILIADDRYALIGGSNIEDGYYFPDRDGKCWHDMLVRIEGEAVGRLLAYFDGLDRWMSGGKSRLRLLTRLLAKHSDRAGPVRWLMGGPFKRPSPLAVALRTDVLAAKQMDMIQAYFAPNYGWLRRLSALARRGRLRVIGAATSDNHTTIAAARHCYKRLLKGGAQVCEFLPRRLHMKLHVIDDVVYAGSANFDVRSLFLNAEIMIRIEDAALADRMRAYVNDHCAYSEIITREAHHQRSTWPMRLRWFAGYWILTALDFNLARNLNWKRS
jgi:cardiolipin synthase A/B